MSAVKEQALELIKKMPDECTVSDIMAELYFIQKVEQGLKDIEDGRVLTQEEVRRQLAQWAKSIGQ